MRLVILLPDLLGDSVNKCPPFAMIFRLLFCHEARQEGLGF
jgi:hypothetical protein